MYGFKLVIVMLLGAELLTFGIVFLMLYCEIKRTSVAIKNNLGTVDLTK